MYTYYILQYTYNENLQNISEKSQVSSRTMAETALSGIIPFPPNHNWTYTKKKPQFFPSTITYY